MGDPQPEEQRGLPRERLVHPRCTGETQEICSTDHSLNDHEMPSVIIDVLRSVVDILASDPSSSVSATIVGGERNITTEALRNPVERWT